MKLQIQVIIILTLFLLVLSFGCIGSSKPANETKLDVVEGVGIVGSMKIDELNPGLDGYVSLDVRSNLEGEGATNVIIALDNVDPFKIVECGATPHSQDDIRTCSGQLDEDKNIPVRMHRTTRLIPGEEIETYWRLKAPTSNEIANIAVKHPIYYEVSYDYKVKFHQNILFMSQNELIKRRQAGEEYMVSGSTQSTAGALRFTPNTQQPIIYFFDYPGESTPEANFSFATQYLVENKGKGFPISDILVIIKYPKDKGIDIDNKVFTDYHWKKISNLGSTMCDTGDSLRTSENMLCKEWIKEVFGKELNVNGNDIIVKKINRTDFVNSFSIYAPFVMTGTERTNLKKNNIGFKMYPFEVYVVYRYFTIGKDYITVYPIRNI